MHLSLKLFFIAFLNLVYYTTFSQTVSKFTLSAFHSEIDNDSLQLAAGEMLSSQNESATVFHGFYPLNKQLKTEYKVEENDFLVFPSPFSNQISIALNQPNSLATLISVYSVNGKLIRQEESNQQLVEMDLSDVSQGIYFVSVSYDGIELITKKVLKL